ncbi:MAG: carbamoyl phosphate synthase small subunit [Bacilli bacterium]|nr:carbamoyl phosphate synthase small subunit [Bacilli bacterium]
MSYSKKLVLENGVVFEGIGYGADVEAVGEVLINTSMVGYQEVASDSVYYEKIVVMTYPLIGSYGINCDYDETKKIKPIAFVVRDYNDQPSNFRSIKTLAELSEENGVSILSDVDTRYLTTILRDQGTMLGIVTNTSNSNEYCMTKIKEYKETFKPTSKVSVKKKWVSKTENPKYDVALIDLGTTSFLVSALNNNRCNVTIVPASIRAEELMALNPDGVILSNGPGNPEDNIELIDLVKKIQGKFPLNGVSLGMQFIALANNAKTRKMKLGHFGCNVPVREIATGKIKITTQNSAYEVIEESLAKTDLEVVFKNVLDTTIQGIKNNKKLVYAIQYYPEDSDDFYGIFIENIKKQQQGV